MAVRPKRRRPPAAAGAATEAPAAPPSPAVTDEGPPTGEPQVSRRQFLTLGGAAAAGLVVGGAVGYALHQPPVVSVAEAPPPPLRFFNAAQLRVIETMAERIFPADSEGPGAKDARVAYYIDGQLASGWGRGERMYRQGPFLTATDSGHGWQVPMTPRDVYSDALVAINTYSKRLFNKRFDQLTAAQQDQALQLMADGKYYDSVVSVGFQGESPAYYAHFLDLDPTYRDAFGQPLLRITFDWEDNERKMIAYAAPKLKEIAENFQPKPKAVSSSSTIAAQHDTVPYQSTHNTGGAIMGADPGTSVVNNYLQMWDFPNVWVVGACNFPQNASFNPTGTVGALAYRAAEGVQKYAKSPGALA